LTQEAETTVRIGDGPEVPLSQFNKAIGTAADPDLLRGHNSGEVAADQLRLFIERIERLEEEKKGIADDIRDVYAEAKSNGYDTKTMRAIVRLRKMETHARQEAGALLETYRVALGIS
jgi:uncharacterized protein (UPF0335 family)